MFDKEKAAKWDNPKKRELVNKQAVFISNVVPDLDSRSVLDFGGGTGLLSEQLYKLTKGITLIDVSSDMLDVANERLKDTNINVINDDILSVDLGAFDLIVCSMSLHHVSDIDNVSNKLSSLLNKNGYLVVFEIEKNNSFHNHKEHNNSFDITKLDDYFNDLVFVSKENFTKMKKNDKEFNIVSFIYKK